jgi:hypothetical protein
MSWVRMETSIRDSAGDWHPQQRLKPFPLVKLGTKTTKNPKSMIFSAQSNDDLADLICASHSLYREFDTAIWP